MAAGTDFKKHLEERRWKDGGQIGGWWERRSSEVRPTAGPFPAWGALGKGRTQSNFQIWGLQVGNVGRGVSGCPRHPHRFRVLQRGHLLFAGRGLLGRHPTNRRDRKGTREPQMEHAEGDLREGKPCPAARVPPPPRDAQVSSPPLHPSSGGSQPSSCSQPSRIAPGLQLTHKPISSSLGLSCAEEWEDGPITPKGDS